MANLLRDSTSYLRERTDEVSEKKLQMETFDIPIHNIYYVLGPRNTGKTTSLSDLIETYPELLTRGTVPAVFRRHPIFKRV